MKKLLLATAAMGFMLSACESNTPTSRSTESTVTDRNAAPTIQAEKKSDLDITQRIKKSIDDDKSLSPKARNIKILAVEGKVTLSGSVSSDQEKSTIARIVKNTSGVKNVDNQLKVE